MSIPGAGSPLFLSAAAAEAAAPHQIDRSLRFNSADTAKLTRSASTAGNRRTWTWSAWVKRASLAASDQYLFGAQGSGQFFLIGFLSTHEFFVNPSAGVSGATLKSNAQFKDPSAWYHIVVAVDTTQSTSSDRVRVYINGDEITSWATSTYPSQNTDWHVNNNVSHSIGASTQSTGYCNVYMTEIHHVDGTQLAASDFGEYDSNNVWQPKDCKDDLTYGTNGFYLKFADNSSNSALGTDSSGNSNTWTVNNLEAGGGSIYARRHEISNPGDKVSNHLNIFDGDTSTTVSSSDGGTVVWTPSSDISISKIEGYFDDSLNGYRITMSVSGGSSQTITLDTGASGNANQWNEFGDLAGDTIGPSNAITFSMLRPAGNDTNPGLHDLNALRINDKLVVLDPRNIDSLIDTPTNYSPDSGNPGGNYATWNPVDINASITLSNGNLDLKGNGDCRTRATLAMPSGKWYWECTIGDVPASNHVGIWATNVLLTNDTYRVIYRGDGFNIIGGTQQTSVSSVTTGDLVGMTFDAATREFKLYKNNSLLLTLTAPALPSGAAYTPAAIMAGTNSTMFTNFGQRPFAYTPPTGFKSLCTQNLADPTIADGSTAFDAKLWTGDGSSSRAITGYNFSPDFVWIKTRSESYGHAIFDIVRGANIRLDSVGANADQTITDGLHSFDSNGFTIGNRNTVGENTETYVGWAWDGGTSTASNTDGSITSNVRANASAGFSIVGYTGTGTAATIGHGLNAAPEFIIVKNRDTARPWSVFHQSITNMSSGYLNLNLTNAFTGSYTGVWNGTDPTSSVFSVGTDNESNNNGDDFIAYCWTSVSQYSSFGSYTGNASSDGPFVYTGFRPKFLLQKNADDTRAWYVVDSSRDDFNPTESRLHPNTADTEANMGESFDFLSNGFKVRATGASLNGSGDTLIYAAFAEHPFKTARAR